MKIKNTLILRNVLAGMFLFVSCAFLPAINAIAAGSAQGSVCPNASTNPCDSACQANPAANKCPDPTGAPQVEIVSPKAGDTVGNPLTITVVRRDNSTITGFYLSVNGTQIHAADLSTAGSGLLFPVTFSLDTTPYDGQTINIAVTVSDDKTQLGTAAVGGIKVNTALGQTGTSNPNNTTPVNVTPTNSSTNPCSADSKSDQICNPLPVNDLKTLVLNLLKYFMGILAIVAVTVIVIAGFRMVLSAGSEEQVKKAKSTITYAIGGLVVALLAFSIVAIVQSIIKK